MKILTVEISEDEPRPSSDFKEGLGRPFAPTMFGGNYFYKKINNKTGGEL